jgi:protease IV
MHRDRVCEPRIRWLAQPVLGLLFVVFSGCVEIPIVGNVHSSFHGDANIAAQVSASLQGPVEVRVPTLSDPGPVQAVPVRSGRGGQVGPRIALVDLDGLILNQNMTGLYSAGENPVAAFREKLEAAAADARVRAIVVRINSPGGGVTACDILAEELRRFRESTGKPVVCCLLDLATSGGYYVAVGGDKIVAHPTTITGGVGALINHYNLRDAMGQLNVTAQAIKTGSLVDMGSVMEPLPEDVEKLLKQMAKGFHDRFHDRVARRRPTITQADWKALADGQVVTGPNALELHLVDRLGYIHDAIDEAERLAGVSGAEVVAFARKGYPVHSLYAITPNTPIQNDVIPFSFPGLDRTRTPTFLYLWQPDPTILRQQGGR